MLHRLELCRGDSGFANDLAKSIDTRRFEYNFDEVASLAMVLDPCFKATFHQASRQNMWLKDIVTRELQAAHVAPVEDIAVSPPTSHPPVASSVWNAFDCLVMNREQAQMAPAPRERNGRISE